jgi:hypothetical protein
MEYQTGGSEMQQENNAMCFESFQNNGNVEATWQITKYYG